jgi:hypothetical protein
MFHRTVVHHAIAHCDAGLLAPGFEERGILFVAHKERLYERVIAG